MSWDCGKCESLIDDDSHECPWCMVDDCRSEIERLTTEVQSRIDIAADLQVKNAKLTAEGSRMRKMILDAEDILSHFTELDGLDIQMWRQEASVYREEVETVSGSQAIRDASCLDAGCDIDGKEPHMPSCDHTTDDSSPEPCEHEWGLPQHSGSVGSVWTCNKCEYRRFSEPVEKGPG